MNYYVARNGQQYGPYTDETVRSYLAAGSLYVSDHIREETSTSWTTIGQLFQIAPAMPPMGQPYPAAQVQPYVIPQGQPYAVAPGMQVIPPDLHWAVVFILGITWIFPFIWAIVQARFANKIDKSSNSTWQLALWILLSIAGLTMNVMITLGNSQGINPYWPLATTIGALVCYFAGIFGIRRSMLDYYNTAEPIQLQLSGVMTFFFGILYLQYHMSRIAHWKKTGVLTT